MVRIHPAMRHFLIWLLAANWVGCGAAEAPGDPPGDPPAAPATIWISNATLVFPLSTDRAAQSMSAAHPADLAQIYTRVGCWIDDPGTWIARGLDGPRSIGPVRLTHIAIVQVATQHYDPDGLGRETCFTYRTASDGRWHALIAPSRVKVAGDQVTTELDVDVEGVDAAAIFLPTYTNVATVSYATR